MIVLLLLVLLSSHSLVLGQEFRSRVDTQTIVADWDSTYKAIITTYSDSQSLELVIGNDTASLPDTIAIGDRIRSAKYVKFNHITAPCLEVTAERSGRFQYYIFEVLPVDQSFPVSGKAIAVVDHTEFASLQKMYLRLGKLYSEDRLEILMEDKNRDRRLDIGFKDQHSGRIYWLFWNKKSHKFKE